MQLDVTTTACLRPEILSQTYSSFFILLKGLKVSTLYINVDPCPIKTSYIPNDVINVAKQFCINTIYRTPEKSCFSSAVNWLWSQANSEFILHLEDDWLLLKEMDISVAISLFKSNAKLNMVRFKHKHKTKYKYGLSPCLIRKSFYKAYAGNLHEDMDPEQQINLRCREFNIEPRAIGKNIEVWPSGVVIRDIGTEWRTSKGIYFVNKDKNHASKVDRVRWSS